MLKVNSEVRITGGAYKGSEGFIVSIDNNSDKVTVNVKGSNVLVPEHLVKGK